MTTTARSSTATVLTPGTRGYDSARSVWNAMIDHRLTAVKDAYDPGNVFHLNHNIAPTRH
jgi:Berberine and berberine like